MSLKPLALAAALLIPSCDDLRSGFFYDRTDTGELKGRLIVEWVDQDKFIFQPDAQDPLTFTRKDKDVLRPGLMYTDGGSVPPVLRALKSYSPWGYAPAFIIHDWLFAMKHCKIPGYEKYDLEKAATIMAEVMKTVMENPKYGGPNKLVHYSMYEGVRSPTAKEWWESGTCDTPSGPKSEAGPAVARPESARAGRMMARPAPADAARPRFVIQF
jgi:hypothetical protein